MEEIRICLFNPWNDSTCGLNCYLHIPSQIVESIILGSAVMDEYKFVNPSVPPASIKAYTLYPAYPDQINFQPPTLPQSWRDKGAEGKQKLAAQMTAWITTFLIILTL